MYKKRFFLILLIYILILPSTPAAPSPKITAEGALLMEARTGKILYEKNALYPFYPASTTKVLSTLLLAENFDIDATITKSQESIQHVPADSSHIGLKVGDRYSYKDGLHAILMASDNFVSYDMAMFHSKNIDTFAQEMNKKSKKLGAYQSNFVNPHGYHDSNHYTTPFDLAILTSAAFKNPIVEQIAGTATYNFTVLNTGKVIPLRHTALLFNPDSPYYNPHVVAAKTGYHTPAGRTLVAKAAYDDIELIAVVMRSGNPTFFEDMNTLLNYGATNFKTSVSDNGIYTIDNLSYSPWAKPYIEDALSNGYYISNLKSYMDAISVYDFYVLLENRFQTPLDKVFGPFDHKISPSLYSSSLTPAKAQTILHHLAASSGLTLPTDFVHTTLKELLKEVPNILNTEEALFLQHAFINFFLTHYPPTVQPFFS